MFSQKISDLINQVEKIGKLKPISQKELLFLLEKCIHGETLEIDEIIELINSTISYENKKLILDFSINYKRPHDQEVLLLPPLYFSSICENKCLYCDFSSSKGMRLSYDEFLNEFNALLDMGYRSIELVSSQDPGLYIKKSSDSDTQLYDIYKAAKYFDIAKKSLEEKGSGMLTSNIPPVDIQSFKKLKSVGLDCYLSWLETFNTNQYPRLHYSNGPKADQAFRLDSFDKAIEAGIEHIAGAFLKGLYNWREEEAILYLFDKYLKTRNGRGFSIIGTPRLKGLIRKSKSVSSYLVSDEDYELNIALDRILFDGILWLQTRESFMFNNKLITDYGGGVILTLTSCTSPGGYHKLSKEKAQFPVFKQNLHKSVNALENAGYKAIFNWNSQTLLDFQRRI